MSDAPGTKLYAANTSKQVQVIYFFQEGMGYRPCYLQPGMQDLVGRRELTDAEVKQTLKHWATYRFLDVTELKRAKHYVGVCYSIGKPIDVDAMLGQYERNDAELNAQAERQLEQTVNAVHHNTEKEIQGPVQHLSVEILETGTVNQPSVSEASARTVAKGIEAVAEGITPHHASGKRGRIGAR